MKKKRRPGCMLGADIKLTGIEKRKAILQEGEDRRKKIQKIEISKSTSNSMLSNSSSSSEDEEVYYEDIGHKIPGPSNSKRAKINCMTFRLSSALNKCKLSDRDAANLLTAVAESFQIDCSKFIINRPAIKRSREHFRKQISESIKSNFTNTHLDYVVLHWDSKLLPDLMSKENINRLPVIVTALNIERLLEVPALSSGTRKEISFSVHNLLQEWGLVDKIQAFVFDMTASNSGRLNGACILLEELLNRDILFFVCRHHIFKLVLHAVFSYTKLTVMNGPDIPLFKKFKNN
jgi:hypothetical protein